MALIHHYLPAAAVPHDVCLLQDQLLAERQGGIEASHCHIGHGPRTLPLPVDDVIGAHGVAVLVEIDDVAEGIGVVHVLQELHHLRIFIPSVSMVTRTTVL